MVQTGGDRMDERNRLYIKLLNNEVNIYARHYVYLGDGKELLKEILAMDTEEYYKWLMDNNNRLPEKNVFTKHKDEREEWYEKAWKGQTEKYFKDNKLKMVEEDIPFDFINETLRKKAGRIEEVIESIEDDLKLFTDYEEDEESGEEDNFWDDILDEEEEGSSNWERLLESLKNEKPVKKKLLRRK